jgi:hypothetical protein
MNNLEQLRFQLGYCPDRVVAGAYHETKIKEPVMNPLVDYIMTHPNWAVELKEKPYNLFIRQDEEFPLLYLFTYNQCASDFYDPVVRVSRGIILEIIEAPAFEGVTDREILSIRVVCHAFDKFGNYGEGYADKIDWNTAKVQEKVDGCLDAHTQIETPEGFRSIQDLCEVNYTGFVRSEDLDSGEPVWDKVEAVSIQEDNGDWYEIETADGHKLILTGNHRVWLPELQCWRRCDELTGEEKVDVV